MIVVDTTTLANCHQRKEDSIKGPLRHLNFNHLIEVVGEPYCKRFKWILSCFSSYSNPIWLFGLRKKRQGGRVILSKIFLICQQEDHKRETMSLEDSFHSEYQGMGLETLRTEPNKAS
uniref:Ovule protein n=1 Tax=Caenorhabditis tropicalis TaxID=1561998 RepID=A0A1I7UES0_9PELO